MAIIVKTENPSQLLSKIKASIREEKIVTWEVDSDGDFTHVPEQWKHKAWLCPKITEDTLNFNILGTKSKSISTVVYGVYHGRFIEMLLSHFDKSFSSARATALPTKNDKIKPSV